MEPWVLPGALADLVRRRAWPEHTHYRISNDENEHQTLHAQVKNLGNQTVWAKLTFNISKNGVPSNIIESEPVLIPEGAIAELLVDFGPLANTDVGKYHVSVTCWYSHNKIAWVQGQERKAFKFHVVL